MTRALTFAAVLLTSLFAASPAYALDKYMWGVGPRIGTHAMPGAFPIQFPGTIADRIEADTSGIEKVLMDVFIGADGVFYLDSHARIGAAMGVGFGRKYSDLHFMARYEQAIRYGTMDFLPGVAFGFGNSVFRGEDDERIRLPTYPLRVSMAGMVRDNTRAYQMTIFAQYSIPANTFYTDQAGDDVDVTGVGIYFSAGFEVQVYFGDFIPPKRGRRGGSGGGASG